MGIVNSNSFGFKQSESLVSLEGDFFGTGYVGITAKQAVAIRQLVQAYMLANKIVDDAIDSLSEEQSQNNWLKLTGDTSSMYRLACAIAKDALGARPWSEGKYEKGIDMLINALSSQYLQESDIQVADIKKQYLTMVAINEFDLPKSKNKLLTESAEIILFTEINL